MELRHPMCWLPDMDSNHDASGHRTSLPSPGPEISMKRNTFPGAA